MLQLCIFGGQQGELSGRFKVYLTLFGGVELRRPTIAQQLMQLREAGRQAGEAQASGSRSVSPAQCGRWTGDRGGGGSAPRFVFVTLFGGVRLKLPSLAQEFLDLQDALRTGVLTLEDWDHGVAALAAGQEARIYPLTLFGSFEAASTPGEDEELEHLALHQHLGHIPPQAAQIMTLAAGEKGLQRHAVVRQAIAASLS